MSTVYDFSAKDIDGKEQNLGAYKGKAMLVVNVASKCGFTPQYKGLEALYEKLGDKGLVVLGFPCDQFGHQEPGDENEIKKFCSLNYDVKFPLFAKIDVNGSNTHPLYKYLKKEAKGLLGTEAIKGLRGLHSIVNAGVGHQSPSLASMPAAFHSWWMR